MSDCSNCAGTGISQAKLVKEPAGRKVVIRLCRRCGSTNERTQAAMAAMSAYGALEIKT